MEELLTTQNTLIILSMIFYGVIFYIQKSQLKKQEGLLIKYEKIFSIINVDEIEKYVNIQKKSLELNYENREIELSNRENEFQKKLDEVDKVLNSSKSNLEKSEFIQAKFNEFNNIIEKNSNQFRRFNEINIEEFKGFYSIIEVFKTENPDAFSKVEKMLMENQKKYDKLKRQELELL